jgi:hypothetical protein
LDTGDAPGVITAKNELLYHLGEPLDTESAVYDSVFAFILFCDALKMLFNPSSPKLAELGRFAGAKTPPHAWKRTENRQNGDVVTHI